MNRHPLKLPVFAASAAIFALSGALVFSQKNIQPPPNPVSAPPPVVVIPAVVSASPIPAQPAGTEAKILVSADLEQTAINGFRNFFTRSNQHPVRVFLTFKSDLEGDAAFRNDGVKRITRDEVEPLVTHPFRQAGAVVYDEDSDQNTLVIEMAISVRKVNFYGPQGDTIQEIPDLSLTARRRSDRAIIGQASTFELLGTAKAWTIYRRIGDKELIRAAALTLLEDMVINTCEAEYAGGVKEWQLALTKEEYSQGNNLVKTPAGGTTDTNRVFALTRDEYMRQSPDQPLKPQLSSFFQARAQKL